MPHRLSIVAFVLSTLVAGSVHAQDREPSPEAMELFRQSAGEYREGRFEEAARLLRQAYDIDPVPVLQYNLARALEGMGDFEGALEAYAIFLEGSPDTDDRGAIEARMETLRRQVEERRALEEAARDDGDPAADTEGSDAAPSPGEGGGGAISPVPWVLVGLGAAGLAAGGVLGFVASERHAQAIDEPEHAAAASLAEEADTLALAANVTFGVAGAIGLAGLIWGIVDVASAGGDDRAVALRVGPGSIDVSGRF